MYKILCHKRDKMRFNQIVQVEEMRFETIEFAKNAVEILSRIFPETIFELLDLEEYAKNQEENFFECLTPGEVEYNLYCHIPGDEG